MRTFRLFLCLTFAGIAAPVWAPVWAQEGNDPCGSPALGQFDFWLGEWQVVDTVSGALVAYDRIEKDLENCVLVQRWTSLDDTFRPSGAVHRMRGMSLSGYDGTQWIQTWVDNMGGMIVLKGGLEDGAMVIQTKETSYGWHYKFHYEPQEDGSIHAHGYTAREGTSDWSKDWDLTYRPNG
jgi:hypothetical protein